MRLYTPEEFKAELETRVGIKSTGRRTATQELWVSIKDPNKFFLAPIVDHMTKVPDYVFDWIVEHHESKMIPADPMMCKNFSVTEKDGNEVLPFKAKKAEGE